MSGEVIWVNFRKKAPKPKKKGWLSFLTGKEEPEEQDTLYLLEESGYVIIEIRAANNNSPRTA
jgi:hypothetical protein